MRKDPTPEEWHLWQALRGQRLNGLRFRFQSVILGYIVDFYCPAFKLVVEVDGSFHDRRRDYDTTRQNAMLRAGFTTIRFTNAQVSQDREAVLNEIRAYLRSRLQDPAPSKLQRKAMMALNCALERPGDLASLPPEKRTVPTQ